MNTIDDVKIIRLQGIWTPQNRNDFDADFKDALFSVQNEFGLDAFCTAGGSIHDVNFYEFELDESNATKVLGVIYVSFIERFPHGERNEVPPKLHLLRYAFELDRQLGELRVGEGIPRS